MIGGDIENPKCNGLATGAETEAIQSLSNSISQEVLPSIIIFILNCLNYSVLKKSVQAVQLTIQL